MKVLICPIHKTVLVLGQTQYGNRYECPKVSCDVICWGGSTSTPADKKTRQIRRKCHKRFDAIWQMHLMTRKEAYRWLRKAMNRPPQTAHIGMANYEESGVLLGKLDDFWNKVQ